MSWRKTSRKGRSSMDSSVFRKRTAHALGGLLALTVCAGTSQAANLLTTTNTTIAISCNAATTGPGAAATVVISPTAAEVTAIGTSALSIAVTFTPVAGLTITPASATLAYSSGSHSIPAVPFTVNAAAGCGTSPATATPTTATSIQFLSQLSTNLAAPNSDISVAITPTV